MSAATPMTSVPIPPGADRPAAGSSPTSAAGHPHPRSYGRLKPRTRVRYRGRLGRAVMPWIDGKWAIQLDGDPRGSYTLVTPSQVDVINRGAIA